MFARSREQAVIIFLFLDDVVNFRFVEMGFVLAVGLVDPILPHDEKMQKPLEAALARRVVFFVFRTGPFVFVLVHDTGNGNLLGFRNALLLGNVQGHRRHRHRRFLFRRGYFRRGHRGFGGPRGGFVEAFVPEGFLRLVRLFRVPLQKTERRALFLPRFLVAVVVVGVVKPFVVPRAAARCKPIPKLVEGQDKRVERVGTGIVRLVVRVVFLVRGKGDVRVLGRVFREKAFLADALGRNRRTHKWRVLRWRRRGRLVFFLPTARVLFIFLMLPAQLVIIDATAVPIVCHVVTASRSYRMYVK